MKILITGGAGFIGSHFVERCLKLGHTVDVVDEFNDFYDPAIKRSNVAAFAKDAAVHELDIRNADAMLRLVKEGRYDTIVHLAARAGVRPSIKDPRLYVETNILGTLNLLEAAKQANVPRFICASSSSVYGPRQRPDLAIHSFSRAIWEGRSIQQFGDGTTRRDYTYVDDIMQGMEACLGYEGQLCDVFNLGESQTTTLSELIATIEASLGKKAIIQKMGEQPGDVPVTYADISKARQLLGYNPHTKIVDGIPKFAEWFKTTVK